MLVNYLIGLREGLEAALLIAILLAALTKLDRRDRFRQVWAGVAAAVAVSLGAGAVLTFGPGTLTFEAQEAIGGGLSILAVVLITSMLFWMVRAAAGLRAELQERVAAAIRIGGPAVFVTAFLAVGREGLETALFLWAGARGAGDAAAPIAGAALGLLTAAVIGWAFYRGSLRINLRAFFAVTGVFLIVVAGGVLAYGVHDLQEAGVLPGLHALAFDVTAAIPPSSVLGTLLKGIFNFSPATTWLEALAWLGYVPAVLMLFLRRLRASPPGPPASRGRRHPTGPFRTAEPGLPTR